MATELLLTTTTDPQVPGVRILHFSGSLDATNLDAAEAKVDELLLGGNITKIIFDFSSLDYLNSRAVGFLVSLSQKVAAAKALLVLAGLKPNVEDIVTIVGLNQIIPVVKTVEDAKFAGDDAADMAA